MAYTLTAPTLLARYDYGPYGKRATLYLSPTYTSGCDLGFTGHITQPNPLATQPNQPNQPDPTELLLTHFRPYDPDSAKWLSPDPIGETGGLNLYGYVLGNPINAWDPLGLDVFFNQECEAGGHAWVKIGGESPTGGIVWEADSDSESRFIAH